ncbi:pimeloyl-ACP methyl ester carboxylesterase [Kineosphaera limosa]|uniref:AB hydrolase-1 domain-containing protein n=1 Tax=Kineosphaera limosa NBRC 100340 TaxID=1184609 RepID=K6XGN4_9MICO|nr:alpha/beta hydrolase [Kineosphaera limosa]NYE01707.1 pimeloyl-ACP methyl ester carboxylesterase [Kineosphaera limosa]GAB97999.1 hypothetical protein KILIM_093_00160 [Kineosphaera limosa NBRC 100340]
MPDMEEYRIPAPEGGHVSVLDFGGDGPDALLVHHIGLSPLEWKPTIAALAGRLRAVAIAWRGHGRSDAPLLPGTQNRRDLVAAVDHLGLDRPMLVAAGWGSAALSLAAAVEHPEKFRSVVTVNGTFPPTRQQVEEEVAVVRSPQMLAYFRDRFRMDTIVPTRTEIEELVALKVERVRADWMLGPEADLEEEVWHGVREVPGGWHTSPKSDTIFGLHDFAPDDPLHPGRTLYERLRLPLRIVHGLESWDYRSETMEYELDRAEPPITVTLLDAGQFPTYTHPQHLADILLQMSGVT